MPGRFSSCPAPLALIRGAECCLNPTCGGPCRIRWKVSGGPGATSTRQGPADAGHPRLTKPQGREALGRSWRRACTFRLASPPRCQSQARQEGRTANLEPSINASSLEQGSWLRKTCLFRQLHVRAQGWGQASSGRPHRQGVPGDLSPPRRSLHCPQVNAVRLLSTTTSTPAFLLPAVLLGN